MIPAEFGSTPWGRAWVRTIESTTAAVPNALLPKARSVARNHAVTLAAGSGRLDAEVAVAGSVHRVRIDLPCWHDREQAEAQRLIAKALADNRGLAAGDLPDTLERDFSDHDISIVVGADNQVVACACRTRRRPCLHILATIYALAQRIDERPALAVELRSAGVELVAPSDPDWVELTDIDTASFYCA